MGQSTDKPKTKGKAQGMPRWSILGGIAVAAFLTVIYISNVIETDKLLNEIRKLKKDYQTVMNYNEMLRSRVNDLESPSRITEIARKELGMIKSTKTPELLP